MFRREVPIQIIFDQEKFQEIKHEMAEMRSEVAKATEELRSVVAELKAATREANKAADKLFEAKKRPINSRSW